MEAEAIELMLNASDRTTAKALRSQLDSIRSVSVDDTGVGQFKEFTLSDHVQPVAGRGSFSLHNVHAEINGGEEYIFFALFIKDGFLHTLESVSPGDVWPIDVREYLVTYTNS